MEPRTQRIALNVIGLVFVSIALLLQRFEGTVSVYAWASLVVALVAMLAARYLRSQMNKPK